LSGGQGGAEGELLRLDLELVAKTEMDGKGETGFGTERHGFGLLLGD
jgi:hypothetical protein